MEIKAGVKVYKGPKTVLVYERRVWTVKYMRPSDIAQYFMTELDRIVQRVKSKETTKKV